MAGPTRLLQDSDQQRLLDEDGYLLFPLFPRSVVVELLELFSLIEPGMLADPQWPGDRDAAASDGEQFRERPDALDDLCYVASPELRYEVHTRLRDIARPWLEQRLRDFDLVGATFMNKSPESPSIVGLHQGWNWVDERVGHYSSQLWVPLVETEQSNGGLGVIPHSHRLEWPYRAFRDDGPFHEHFPTLIHRYYRAYSVRAGEALMFHARLVHGSPKNRIPAHRPIAVLVVVPRAATKVHYLRVDERRVHAYTMSSRSSDTLVAGTPPAGERSLGIIEHDMVPPTAREVEALLDRPLLNDLKGNLPEPRTIDDLLRAARGEAGQGGDLGYEAAADVAGGAPGRRPAPDQADVDCFLDLYGAGAPLPWRLPPGWILAAVEADDRGGGRFELHLRREEDGLSFPAWAERRREGRKAFAETRELAIGHGSLPEGVSSPDAGSVLQRLVARLHVAERQFEAAGDRLFRPPEPEPVAGGEGSAPAEPVFAEIEIGKDVRRVVRRPPYPIPKVRLFQDPALDECMWRDGFVVVSLLDASELEEARERWERARDGGAWGALLSPSRAAEARVADLVGMHHMRTDDARREVMAWIDHWGGDRCRRLMREDLRSYAGQFLIKPRGGGATSWHLDASLVDPARYAAARVWCALDDVTEREGCVRVLPGTHRVSGYVRGWGHDIRRGPLAAHLERQIQGARSVTLRAGEALIWNPGLVHSSLPNRGTSDRVALSVTMAEPEARFIYPLAISEDEVACFEAEAEAVSAASPADYDLEAWGEPAWVSVVSRPLSAEDLDAATGRTPAGAGC